MEKLVDDGLVKSIGISNFSCKKIDALLEYARIKPVAVQVEVHPYFRNQKLMDHCKAKVCFQKHRKVSIRMLCILCVQAVCYLLCEKATAMMRSIKVAFSCFKQYEGELPNAMLALVWTESSAMYPSALLVTDA